MRLRKILFLSLSIWLLLAVASGRAQTPHPSVYQLKAAFIYNFAKFVDWPPSAFADQESPFVIGILGDNPFGSNFGEMVAGKKIDQHPISVQTFHAVTEAGHCQILFVSSSEKKNFPEIIRHLQGMPVLTVAETDGFLEAGGMINFVEQDGKIRFQISDTAAKAAHLKISSKLLSLAINLPH